MKMILFFFFLMIGLSTAVYGQSQETVITDDSQLTDVPEMIKKIASGRIEWIRVDSVPLDFKTFHTQGLIKVKDYFFLTAVEVKRWPRPYPAPNGRYDRDQGEGIGHVFKFNKEGRLIQQIQIGENAIYHPGGLDFDGENLWIPVCEYRPFGNSILYSIDPETMAVQTEIRVDDAIGAVAFDRWSGKLIGANWNSVDFYTWQLNQKKEVTGPVSKQRNFHFNVAIQDMQYIDQGFILGSGLFNYKKHPEIKQFSAGGILILKASDFSSFAAIPVDLYTSAGQVMTGNPFFAELVSDRVYFHFIPEDDRSNLYIYELR